MDFKSPLIPPLKKGETRPLPFAKGDSEGFKMEIIKEGLVPLSTPPKLL
jgi:hypothetical protein